MRKFISSTVKPSLQASLLTIIGIPLLRTAVLVPEIPISIIMDTSVSVMHTPGSVFLVPVFRKCNYIIL